jgi:hypothetical protein
MYKQRPKSAEITLHAGLEASGNRATFSIFHFNIISCFTRTHFCWQEIKKQIKLILFGDAESYCGNASQFGLTCVAFAKVPLYSL